MGIIVKIILLGMGCCFSGEDDIDGLVSYCLIVFLFECYVIVIDKLYVSL